MLANDGATIYSIDVDSIFVFQRGALRKTDATPEEAVGQSDVVVTVRGTLAFFFCFFVLRFFVFVCVFLCSFCVYFLFVCVLLCPFCDFSCLFLRFFCVCLRVLYLFCVYLRLFACFCVRFAIFYAPAAWL